MPDTGKDLMGTAVAITLKDGSIHQLKLGFLAWAELEALYGSLDAALVTGATLAGTGRVLTHLWRFIWAALLHERYRPELPPDMQPRQWTIAELESLLLLTKRVEYLKAVAAAVEAAMFEADPQ